MRSNVRVLRVLVAGVCLLACEGEPAGVRLEEFSPLAELPEDPTNQWADDDDAATLGQRFFFETAWAGEVIEASERGAEGETMELSCASCHLPDRPGLDEGRERALGAKEGAHNTPPLLNASFYEWGGWAGKFDSQWSTPLFVFEAAGVFNSSRLRVVRVVVERHRSEYEAVFGSGSLDAVEGLPDEALSSAQQDAANDVFVNVGKALAAYCRTLVSRTSAFDDFVAGDDTAISEQAKQGLDVFFHAGCDSCHSGPRFTDDEFHNIGVSGGSGREGAIVALLESEWNGASVYSDDSGAGEAKLAALEQEEYTEGAFRTKSLRDVAETAPYMHDGRYEDLGAVLDGYNERHGGGDGNELPEEPLDLTETDKAALEAFLNTLTSEPLPDGLLVNPLVP